ncbi:inactive pancreatic lipase-related protein 1-like [Montipora foliosa]|uniref:inactive pancreatic lipase-related protein 1-like n=1 Tax=Montipora foliosa TaxID=591990 RepID=UPI0035F12DE2
MSDADFYPNGGKTQLGCPFFSIKACDHLRAPDYYIATVKGLYDWTAYPCESYKVFQGGKCLQCEPDGCSRMGYYAESSKTGNFYLNTNKKKPFCDERP